MATPTPIELNKLINQIQTGEISASATVEVTGALLLELIVGKLTSEKRLDECRSKMESMEKSKYDLQLELNKEKRERALLQTKLEDAQQQELIQRRRAVSSERDQTAFTEKLASIVGSTPTYKIVNSQILDIKG
jgi:hypothetical protein